MQVLKDLSNTPTAVSPSANPKSSPLAVSAAEIPTTPLAPPNRHVSASDNGDVFATKELLMHYLSEHPVL